jgi:hypothetical protein
MYVYVHCGSRVCACVPADMPLGACGSVKEYDIVCRVGEGTYGLVFKARHLKTGQLVALKKVILHNEESDGVRNPLRAACICEARTHGCVAAARCWLSKVNPACALVYAVSCPGCWVCAHTVFVCVRLPCRSSHKPPCERSRP